LAYDVGTVSPADGHSFTDIAPTTEYGVQNLILFEKEVKRKVICEVLYVFLRGKCGVKKDENG